MTWRTSLVDNDRRESDPRSDSARPTGLRWTRTTPGARPCRDLIFCYGSAMMELLIVVLGLAALPRSRCIVSWRLSLEEQPIRGSRRQLETVNNPWKIYVGKVVIQMRRAGPDRDGSLRPRTADHIRLLGDLMIREHLVDRGVIAKQRVTSLAADRRCPSRVVVRTSKFASNVTC